MAAKPNDPADDSRAVSPPETPPESAVSPSTGEVRVKYTGPSVHTRVLAAADAKKAGVEGFEKTSWNASNNHIVTFEKPPTGLVEWLTGMGNFKVLKPGETS